jgi:hypothetical protein
MDRSSCNYGIRHIFNVSIVATSSAKGNSLLDKIWRNWQSSNFRRISSAGDPRILQFPMKLIF